MLQRVLHGVGHLDNRTNGINPGLRTGAIISSAVHLVILLLLLLGLPFAQPAPEPQETAIAMVFDGTAEILNSRCGASRCPCTGSRA